MKKPKDYLENCEYISQDGDTVYIDEEALETCMGQYANQKIVEELEVIVKGMWGNNKVDYLYAVKERIKELKHQD